MPPFEKREAYCFASAGRLVDRSLDQAMYAQCILTPLPESDQTW